ncbi:MAG TPA: DUF1801 domain-containing protein [Rhizomicrobium sp.]|jgi:hypothetical protein|nr:DUF1801 domain-containing protein [Rhizomicrobium sp.]
MGAVAKAERPSTGRRKHRTKSARASAQQAAGGQLDGFIAKFTPGVAAQITDVLVRMRTKLPGAVELVYDNYNALAIGFASGERIADLIFSVACYPRWVSLFFFPGVDLEDPQGLLKGSGTKCRHIVIRSPAMLDDPGVSDLMRRALEKSDHPIDARAEVRIIIKSVSAKQRPRRPPGA